MNRLTVRLIGVVVVVGIVIGMKVYNKNKASDTIKTDTFTLVQKLPSYENNKTYIDGVFESSYQAAFESSYSVGGRHQSASFDTVKYIGIVFDNMTAMAQRDGRNKVAEELQAYKTLLLASLQEQEQQ